MNKTMKKLMIGVSLLSVFSISTFAEVCQNDTATVVLAGPGDFVPWPLNLQIPFPWDEIQGTWKFANGSKTSFYQISIVENEKSDVKILLVRQFDGETCRILSEGRGVERNKLIAAQMYEYSTKSTYRVSLGAFNPSDIECAATSCRGYVSSQETVLMMSLPSLRLGKKAQGAILTKVFHQCGMLMSGDNNF